MFYVFSRAKYGESEFVGASKRLECLSEDNLRQSSTTFHASCRKTTVSFEKLKRTRNRLEKAAASKDVAVHSRTPGRPSLESRPCSSLKPSETPDVPKRISRTVTAAYNKELCFFCQTHDEKQSVHAIQTENRGTQLCDFVKKCENDLYKVYLSTAIKPEDAISIGVKYHRTCWTKQIVRGGENTPQHEATVKQDTEIAVNIEFLNLIRTLLEKGRILSLDDAQKAYMDILHYRYHRRKLSPARKYLRELIVANIHGIEFVRAFRRNESDRFCLTATKIAAIDSAVNNSSDSDLKVIFR